METPRGREAISHYPFREITLKHADAVEKLNQRSISVFNANSDSVIASLNPKSPEVSAYIDCLKKERKENGQPGEEELSALDATVSIMLSEAWGDSTLKSTTALAIDEIFPKILEEEKTVDARNPHIVCLEYLLDMLRIIDPKVATFDEGVRAMVEGIRGSKYMSSFLKFGMMVDDTINLRAIDGRGFDLYADVEAAKEFSKNVFCFANLEEKLDFEAGLNLISGAGWGVVRYSSESLGNSEDFKLPAITHAKGKRLIRKYS